ncbi:MAG TPA: hypothetical protein VEJ18_07910 [Planctomycetota bacterium]|nr:hypothetical protein [Planctomycetota bacterium]
MRTSRPVLVFLALVLAVSTAGCGRKKVVRSGPLNQWIVGQWVRTDEGIVYEFKADGEMITTGALPVAGSYSTEEPATVKVLISGANAHTTSAQLGVPVDPVSQSLELVFNVQDDEMRVVGIKSDVVWRKIVK